MTEHPILMSAPMVRAILAGTKTQTRRLLRLPAGCGVGTYTSPGEPVEYVLTDADGDPCDAPFPRCPYGVVGDHLWVREAWNYTSGYTDENGGWCPTVPVAYRADGPHQRVTRWRPSIHMPRAFCRIVLRVEAVRVERLHAITLADVLAEGFTDAPNIIPRAVDAFAGLWDKINGKRPGASWDRNPHIWVVTFARVPA